MLLSFYTFGSVSCLLKTKILKQPPKNNIRTLTISHATISGRLISLDNVSVQPEITRSTFSFFLPGFIRTRKEIKFVDNIVFLSRVRNSGLVNVCSRFYFMLFYQFTARCFQ